MAVYVCNGPAWTHLSECEIQLVHHSPNRVQSPCPSVSLTQCICPPRYSSGRDLGFQSTLSAVAHRANVSCARSSAGRIQYLCVISSYDLVGLGLKALKHGVGCNPSLHCLSSSFKLRRFSKPFPDMQEIATSDPHTFCMWTRPGTSIPTHEQ